MKEMEIKNKPQMQMAISEAEMLKDIMENVSHPNIMHIEKVFQVGSKFYLVFPLCTGGELYEHIIRRGHFTEHDAAIITKDLISGLHALHTHDILHLDIKPENILFDSMGEDARIKITDFGLSKIFPDSASNAQKQKFNMKLMEDRLKAFQDTGELSREKLRGTIGYMAPELILTGHCSRATDVFAAGVVLYILLCGRPPFNSKSNREVLEKTARGQFSLTGAEWDDISEEAKDLVGKMLVVNPEHRISTTDILNHPWIKQLEEENDDVSSTSSASDQLSSTKSLSINSRTNTFNRKGTGLNLSNALRHLSGHVRQMRSEKLASNVTRLVSMMQHANGGRSTLSQLYLIDNIAPGEVSTKSPGKLPTKVASTTPASAAPVDDHTFDNLYLNTDFRDALAKSLHNLSESNTGKITVEQFVAILKYLFASENNATSSTTSSSSTNSTNNQQLGPYIISRFMDRDNDGYITADDIFAAQALIMQRSELFLKIVFRIYTESIWYPGRQLNYMNMMQSSNANSRATSTSGQPPATPGGSKVLNNDIPCLSTVVEPPKFITQRHVSAIFEKLGYDGSNGAKIFSILAEAVSRIKSVDVSKYGEAPRTTSYYDDNDSNSPLESMSSKSAFASFQSPPPPPTISEPSKPNAALAKAFGDSDDEDTSSKSPLPTIEEENNTRRSSFTKTQSERMSQRASDLTNNKDPASSTPSSSANINNNLRMDFQDFVRAVELDDVLIQALFRRPRTKLVNLMSTAEQQARDNIQEIINNNGGSRNASDDRTLDRGNTLSNENASSKNIKRLSSDIMTSVIEGEFRNAFNQMKTSESTKRPAFPIANAVGRATISAAIGLAAKVTSGAQAFMEATTYETMDEESTNNPDNINNNANNTNRNSSSTKSLSRRSSRNSSSFFKSKQEIDSDDEV